MGAASFLLSMVIVAAHGMAVLAWSNIFWSEIEPWLRRTLSRRWNVCIVLRHASRVRGWKVKDDTSRYYTTVRVAAAALAVVGIFAPGLLTAVVFIVGSLPHHLAPPMVLVSVACGAIAARLAHEPPREG